MAKYDPDEFFNRKKPTNADRIRSLSDEELAEFIESCACPPHKDCDYTKTGCIKCWLDWLKSKAEVE